jgi:hypothetical protein
MDMENKMSEKALMYREKRQAKKFRENILLFAIVLAIIGIPIGIIYTAFSNSSEDNKKSRYDGEYWRSVNREQQFKDAGLDEFAKIERRERRKRLKNK